MCSQGSFKGVKLTAQNIRDLAGQKKTLLDVCMILKTLLTASQLGYGYPCSTPAPLEEMNIGSYNAVLSASKFVN